MEIRETCSCGSSIDVTGNKQEARGAVTEWRTNHKCMSQRPTKVPQWPTDTPWWWRPTPQIPSKPSS